MMGIKFAPGFLYSFAFGCLFIAIFAWKRFSVKSDVRSVSRALTDLNPSDIGGNGALMRAYFIYAGAILLLYVSLTFFGRLIVQTTQMMPVVGIELDLDKLQFDSMQWPLMLAFGFAGLAEMLPPIKVTEGWLRNRAYRAVGIPVRLEQTMRNLIVTLDRACASDSSSSDDPLVQCLARHRVRWSATVSNHEWTKAIGAHRLSQQEEVIRLMAQLEMLIFWAKSARGNWPGHEVSSLVREKEVQFVADAVKLLDELHGRMHEVAPHQDELTAIRKSRFAEFLGRVIAQATSLRFDLVGILAIYLERDPDSPHTEPPPRPQDKGRPADQEADPASQRLDPALHRLLTGTERPDTAGTGPEAGLFLALIAVFLLYAAAAWRGIQEPIGQYVETTNVYGVLATALVETLRIAALTWLPLLAAFSLRQYMWDNGDWAGAARSQRRSGYALQIFGCLCLGGTVSMLSLAAVGALKAFFIAPSSMYFFSLFLGSEAPFFIYYPSQAIILLVLIPISLLSADLRKTAATRLWYGVFAALAVMFLSVEHLLYWNASLPQRCPGLAALSSTNCALRYDLLSHLVLGVLAFLAAGLLGELPERSRLAAQRWAASAAAALLLVLMTPQHGTAQTPPAGPAYRIGFREDAPPFSSVVAQTGAQTGAQKTKPYAGFLADLCFDIFAGYPAFPITAVPVNANNRFDKLHNGSIDMLCDAVTMRFSDPDRSRNTVFSPIVFTSGVSYLDKPPRLPWQDILIGFIGNSTAGKVARKTCEIDYFNAMLPDQRAVLFQRCKLRWTAAMARSELRRAGYAGAGSAPGPARIAPARRSLAAFIDAARRLDKAMGAKNNMLSAQTQRLLPVRNPEMASDAVAVATACLGRGGRTECDTLVDLLHDPLCEGPAPAVEASEKRGAVELGPWPDYHFCPQSSHGALIEWFCDTPRNQRRIYMGDRELILNRLEGWIGLHGPCATERPLGAEYLSYEPYAFPVTLAKPQLIQFVQQRIYQIFSDRRKMNARFVGSFPESEMSPALAYLFLLNAIENGEPSLDDPRTGGAD